MQSLNRFSNQILLLFSIAAVGFAGCKPKPQFVRHSPEQTGITFANTITESDSINILENEYIYNGGGVGVADMNQDGLMDLVFSGNMVSNKLYLNQGDFTFQDISDESGLSEEKRWSSGISIVDINRDGWPDIYICATNRDDDPYRDNQLFIHQGLDESGIPHFVDLAAEYGVRDQSHSTQATFFDYDKDGDLDLFVIVDEVDEKGSPNTFRPKKEDGSSPTTDRLYQNTWSDSLGHPLFTNVSTAAGILHEGYSLGVNITDINRDGWPDIYVTNDYVTNDLLYLNQQDGTFMDVASDIFKHTCHAAMGNDVIDLDHDGRVDILALDMMPESNFRKKTMLMSNNYNAYINNDRYDYDYQYVRNVYQHNEGIHPETGLPVFSDISMMAGIAETDWSWTPSVADFDLDGQRDILITNGFPKDITDRDFVDYHSEVYGFADYEFLQRRIPSVKLNNYAFRQDGNLQYENVSAEWGMDIPSFSSGAAYVDLDNDGDLDWVVNNIDDPAFIYENTQLIDPAHNWLSVKLNGTKLNPDGIGAWVEIWAGEAHQVWEHTLIRGYLSSVDPRIHFGLGAHSVVDSIKVTRPDGLSQFLTNVPVNQLVAIDLSAGEWDEVPVQLMKSTPMFTDQTVELGLQYVDRDSDYIDFNVQRLIPHKLSQYGPGLAVADIDGDGLEDLYVTGPRFRTGTFFLQQSDGTFASAALWDSTGDISGEEEEMGALFFDADQDGDQDLYIVSGSVEFVGENLPTYRDKLYLNDNGSFKAQLDALPELFESGSAVKAVDYDQDGDLDLFVGGRSVPGKYPSPVNSYFLKNNSSPGNLLFEIDQENSALLASIGMVCDALWTDPDGDGWMDLLIAGEWMPVTLLKNKQGKFENATKGSGLGNAVGWWNSLAGGDFDRDGDTDYLVGNLGLNSLNQATDQRPIGIVAADFDVNGGYDAIPTAYYLNEDGSYGERTVFGRIDLEKQLPELKRKYPFHADYAQASVEEVTSLFSTSFLQYKANHLSSSWIENLGDGTFKIHPLPRSCQTAPIYGMVVDDLNQDGYPDIVAVGNDFGTELTIGKYDASNGWVLLNGPEGFHSVPFLESGLFIPGDAKALVKILGPESIRYVASRNQDSLSAVSMPIFPQQRLGPGEVFLQKNADGSVTKIEGYCGSGYLSQSSSTYSVRLP